VEKDCLSMNEHYEKYKLTGVNSSPTAQNGCMHAATSLQVKVVRYQGHRVKSGRLPDLPLELWITAGVVCLILGAFAVMKALCRSKVKCLAPFTFGRSEPIRGEEENNRARDTARHPKSNSNSSLRRSFSAPLSGSTLGKQLGRNSSKKSCASDESIVAIYSALYKKGTSTSQSITDEHDDSESEESVGDNGTIEDHRPRWIQYFDASSGDYYYADRQSRRVTWTEPKEGYCSHDDNIDR